MTHAPRHQSWLMSVTRPGVKLSGEVSTPTDLQSLNFDVPLRMLTTPARSVVEPGDVVLYEGVRYLTGFYAQTKDARHLRMVPLPQEVAHERVETTIDPVTKLERAQAKVSLGKIWCHQIVTGEVADGHSKAQQVRIITGAEIRVGDTVGGRKIQRIRSELGLQIAEAA